MEIRRVRRGFAKAAASAETLEKRKILLLPNQHTLRTAHEERIYLCARSLRTRDE